MASKRTRSEHRATNQDMPEIVGIQESRDNLPSFNSPEPAVSVLGRGDTTWGDNPHQIVEDATLARMAIKYSWGTAADRTALAEAMHGMFKRAVAAGDVKAACATGKMLMEADRITLATLPQLPREVQHSGVIGHKHAVVMLPSKQPAALLSSQ